MPDMSRSAEWQETARPGSYTAREDWDLELVHGLFQEIRGVEASGERFRWLYRGNPAGLARVWILHDPSGAPVGVTAAHPREVWVEGRVCPALNCGDFSVAVGHRTLGPAAILRRPAKALADTGEYAFLYAHPLPAMLAVHVRVGHRQLGEMVRWTHPLRADDAVEHRLGRSAARIVAPSLTLGLRLRRWLKHRRLPTSVATREVGSFGPDFDDLDQRLGQQYRVIGRRNQAYLAWRFQERPGLAASIVEARNGEGRLMGYLVLELIDKACKVLDAAYLPDPDVAAALWSHALRRGIESAGHSLSVVVLESNLATPALKTLGFFRREENQPAVCYGGTSFWGKTTVENASNWFMTVGDRDI